MLQVHGPESSFSKRSLDTYALLTPQFRAIYCGVRIELVCLFVPRPIWTTNSKPWRSEANLDSNCKPSLGREAKSHFPSFMVGVHSNKQQTKSGNCTPPKKLYNINIGYLYSKQQTIVFHGINSCTQND